ncbi:hypothetical protein M501DRAFT_927330 [Patellaria atrata CBS 101060]|uniref:DUF8021 domain-containing protein n=1 Tax=Patellaria atrata CBS 101060 TaxID=1346257 RepID=A0A9P4SFU9_9PEZI|nr:hypothetical protein M501DRAFT_927330 [Patellaria atrata CBS 101060]
MTIIGTLIPFTRAECTRDSLKYAADLYLGSQNSGLIQEIFSSVTYVQNNKTIPITDSILKQAMSIAHNKTIVDTTTCATYTEVIITDPSNPHVIGTQIHHTVSNGTSKPTLIDSIVTGPGDWLFNATKTLAYITGESWDPIPASAQDTRTTLKSAADAYLDLWGNPDAPVPWGTPCTRLEGSAYTGKGAPDDSCAIGIPGGEQPPNTNRRYVVDEGMGSVSVLVDFGAMRSGAPDSHEFRLEGGRLRYVHTMTVMTTGTAS